MAAQTDLRQQSKAEPTSNVVPMKSAAGEAAPAVAPVSAPLKDLYEIGEIPPLGHVPAKMYAWTIRAERHGPPDQAMQVGAADVGARQPRRAGPRDGGGRQLQRR